ncbi:DUF362 domain-containing protein [Chloroflexota bacterium]
MAKSVVSIAKGTDAEKLVEEALSLLGGVTSLIKPNSTVVVKPNAGHPVPPERSGCTSPAVVAAVIKELRKAQPKEIILAEASARGCDTLECFEVSGIGKAAEDAGADRIIDIKRDKDLISIPIRDAKSDLTRVLLPRFLVEADHIVNLPLFKAHVAMIFTCALKNLKGVVQDKVHYEMHQTDLGLAMVDLFSVAKPDLSIADMIHPAEGFGEASQMPVDFGCIVASKDPVALDTTACRMVGLPVDKVHYFQSAQERGLGNVAEKQIEIRGRTIEEVFQQLWFPYMEGYEQWPEYNIDTEGACSSCLGTLGAVFERLKFLGEYEKNAGITILTGRKKEIPEGIPRKDLILIGNCLKKYRDRGILVEGCPPGGGSGNPVYAIVNREEQIPGQDMKRTAATTEAEAKAWRDYQVKLREKWLSQRQGRKS